ncbi:MAG TPA: heavy-metal-associated domain-containing protein [Nocardioidaceae bacterium]|nr:heavy-metal-associated domain-containing protein [Nocardioidaceae bacterium]
MPSHDSCVRDDSDPDDQEGTIMSNAVTSYTVTGMTCEHCVASVTEEVSEVAGVVDVKVDLASGGLTVTSVEPVTDDAIRSAIEEAGYVLASPGA